MKRNQTLKNFVPAKYAREGIGLWLKCRITDLTDFTAVRVVRTVR
jgi:hypothetical protein